MVYDNTFYLPTQNSSSYSSNFCSEDDVNILSSPIIANLRLMKHNHNSASTSISIPSSLEYEKNFYLPTQDLSSVSSMFSCSDDSVVIQHTNTTKINWKRCILYSSDSPCSLSSIDSPSPFYKQTKKISNR